MNELPAFIRPTGIKNVYVNLSDEIVLVESSLPSSVVQQRLEGTGRLVVFRGYGGQGMQLYHNTDPLSSSAHTALLLIIKQIMQGHPLVITELLFVFLNHTVPEVG